MEMRRLGRSGVQVSPLCFGGNVFGWTADESMSFQLLDAFVAAGFNFVDTADMYSTWVPGHHGGESETIIGKWFARSGKRASVVLASKVGMDMGEGRKGLARSYIVRAVEDSLRRLGTDYIELYQSHTDDNETPLDETLAAYDQLISQGKVRAIGASNYSAARLAEALQVSVDRRLPAYICLQPEYNLYDRAGFEAELEPLCLKHGLAVIPYWSLASGFLSGKYRSPADAGKSARGGGIVKKYINDRGMRILAAIDTLAAQRSATPTQVALAWLLARPSITAPIVSATSLVQLQDVLASAALRLTASEVDQLNSASA